MSGTVRFHLPDVGEGIAQAEIIEWLVKLGDEVSEDQPIVLIETDKSQLELPSPAAGRIAALEAAEGTVVEVGAPLVRIDAVSNGELAGDAAGQPSTSGDPTARRPEAPGTTVEASSQAVEAGHPKRRSRRPLASPSTRKLAVRAGVDLALVEGSGPHGRILASDIDATSSGAPTARIDPALERTLEAAPTISASSSLDAQAASDPAPTTVSAREDETTVIPLRGLRRQIAQSMSEALAIPHVSEFREVDASAIVAARRVLKPRLERDGMRLSILPILVKSVTWALARHPGLNATFDARKGEITQYRSVHLGVATATDDGLIVPVLRHSESLTLREVAAEIERLSERARNRTATATELTNGTFTITNFGSFGAWLGTPIIRPPEVAIAGFGRIQDKVIAVDGSPEVRPVLPLVVAADHRINDGADLGAFVSDIAAALEQPMLLLDSN